MCHLVDNLYTKLIFCYFYHSAHERSLISNGAQDSENSTMPLLRNLKIKPEISIKRKYKSFANVSEHMEILETRSSSQNLPSRNLEWVQKQLMRFDEEMWQTREMKKQKKCEIEEEADLPMEIEIETCHDAIEYLPDSFSDLEHFEDEEDLIINRPIRAGSP